MITKFKKYVVYFVANICVLLGLCSLINCIDFDLLVVSDRNVISHALVELANKTEEDSNETSYTNYLAKYSNVETKVVYQSFIAANVLISDSTILSKEESFEYDNKTVKLENKQTAEFKLDVKEAGLYEIYIDYYFCDSSINDVEANFKINQEFPYYEARQVIFKADWIPTTKEFEKDRYGNEIIPSSNKEFKWYKESNNQGILSDGSRLFSGTLKGYFEAGINDFSLQVLNGNLLIGTITLKQEKQLINYETYFNQHQDKKVIQTLSTLEPELIDSKSDIAIRINSDVDPASTPYDTKDKKLNNIYINSWSKSNQSVSWYNKK